MAFSPLLITITLYIQLLCSHYSAPVNNSIWECRLKIATFSGFLKLIRNPDYIWNFLILKALYGQKQLQVRYGPQV